MSELTQDQKILYSLANTMSATRSEIDGIRTVLIALASTLSEHPEMAGLFAEKVLAAKEGTLSHALGTVQSDQQIEAQQRWIEQLAPHVFRQPPKG
ncbi:MAG: hypothetical protein AB1455_09955 [Pseudomonadota bacterium]